MVGPGMIVTKISYEIIQYPEWHQKPTYRRFSFGWWEIERWDDHAGDDYWAPLENAKLEKMLEAEYQELLEQRKLAWSKGERTVE